ncbi:hypothetical protein AVEN_250558-1 [Araneus ventricosus]|uniref:Endonuclease/exonuclease/phosphatase domain-containing protein n=1 Tax=Araneus ventricosus TaxID=182803 RepID=A0A4Y2FW18_ARAVE|nr:hypothetical protein AVEN_250558-1 [Araneus ventricosus]
MASETFTVAIKLQTGQNPTTFNSAYNSPHTNFQETLLELQEIITSVRDESIIIGADLNGHHTMWVYRDIDSRGERIFEFHLAKTLFIANSPDAPSAFERGIFKGWPDLTISSQGIISKFVKWQELSHDPTDNHSVARK